MLAQAQNANKKAQMVIDKYSDDNAVFYSLYNSIIHKMVKLVNDLTPIDKQYNRVFYDLYNYIIYKILNFVNDLTYSKLKTDKLELIDIKLQCKI